MTVKELIGALKKMPGDAVVVAYDDEGNICDVHDATEFYMNQLIVGGSNAEVVLIEA